MRKITTFAGLGIAAALVFTGCSAATPESTSSEKPAATEEAPKIDTVNSDGAELRAQLTALLADHVYLAGAAIDQAVDDKGDLKTKDVGGAVAALDANSVEISKLVGSAYPDAEEPFLASWRSHIPFFVDYTIGKATKDDAKVEKAKKDLGAYAVSFGELINSVVPELPAEAVQAELETHATSLLAAIDAKLAGDPNRFQLLKEAAGHMPMTAKALAGGIAANKGIQ